MAPLPIMAGVAGAKVGQKVYKKLTHKGKPSHAAAPKRRRQRRIVFSENQWQFVGQLIRFTRGGGGFPRGGGGGRRRGRRRGPFR